MKNNHLSALKACFPGGSISGAPKCRALEIINELETHPREYLYRFYWLLWY